MTLKNTKISTKNLSFFAEKFFENILTHSQKFSAKIFRFWSKKWLILQDFGKLRKKNLQKQKIFGLVLPIKWGFFFVALCK